MFFLLKWMSATLVTDHSLDSFSNYFSTMLRIKQVSNKYLLAIFKIAFREKTDFHFQVVDSRMW